MHKNVFYNAPFMYKILFFILIMIGLLPSTYSLDREGPVPYLHPQSQHKLATYAGSLCGLTVKGES